MRIRVEAPGDVEAIRVLNDRAFGNPAEARIVDALRKRCADLLSLVAERDGRIVGHILFSPVALDAPADSVVGMGLAPMAVEPGLQRQGIGSALVRRGLELLRQRGCPFVIVLGHPAYYPRFGFEPASNHGIGCQWDGVPDEAFMILVFERTAVDGSPGVARYREEFDAAMEQSE